MRLTLVHTTSMLSAYIHNELTPAERLKVDTHLTTCTTCNDVMQVFRRGAEAAGELPRVPAPDGLWKRIETEVGRSRGMEASEERPTGQTLRSVLPKFVLAIMALAILGIAIVLVRSERHNRVGETTEGPTEINLSPYLDRIEAAGRESLNAVMIAQLPGFEPVSRAEAMEVALLGNSGPDFAKGFELVAQRIATVGRKKAVQLVFRKQDYLISVIIGQPGLMFTTGRRETERTKIGNVSGGRFSRGNLLAFFWGSPSMHCGFIARAGLEEELRPMLESFRQAYHPQ